jgi:hypothetical protein
MPPSLSVHTVKLIIAKAGDYEGAEWITGDPGSYSHREAKLDEAKVSKLVAGLSHLHTAEQKIQFRGIDCDLGEYEGAVRKVLRFRSGSEEHELFLPSPAFYKDFEIDNDVQVEYELAFEAVYSELPLNWITWRSTEMGV